ncbi:MAG: hypothetical protein ETSY1_18370 [Candidatus Entotheonella factor]|uniref:Uncharacterized protein n=1 Tax=Entotheonella factor TaxID=1429438 RepID=W4LKA3_ENTF1|nr:MAG: hypothetical protein ETSY1_18370 [Candidatus Entotheonella factor]
MAEAPVLYNSSCQLLEIHGILRFNEGEISITLDEEKTRWTKKL